MANKQVSSRAEIWKNAPFYADWIVARAVVISPSARAWFLRHNYAPGIFRCPIAKAAVVWAMTSRKSMPHTLATRIGLSVDGYQSFGEFLLEPTAREVGDGDYDQSEPEIVWEDARLCRELREWAPRLASRGGVA